MKRSLFFDVARGPDRAWLLGGAVAIAQNAKPRPGAVPPASAANPIPAAISDITGFHKTVAPFFQGTLRTLPQRSQAKGEFAWTHCRKTSSTCCQDKWGEVVNVLNAHRCRPKDEKEPPRTGRAV